MSSINRGIGQLIFITIKSSALKTWGMKLFWTAESIFLAGKKPCNGITCFLKVGRKNWGTGPGASWRGATWRDVTHRHDGGAPAASSQWKAELWQATNLIRQDGYLDAPCCQDTVGDLANNFPIEYQWQDGPGAGGRGGVGQYINNNPLLLRYMIMGSLLGSRRGDTAMVGGARLGQHKYPHSKWGWVYVM